jgi:hypothetical protein
LPREEKFGAGVCRFPKTGVQEDIGVR